MTLNRIETRKIYRHVDSGEHLKVDHVTLPDSNSPGFVGCHHPIGEEGHDLPLIWEYQPFSDSFELDDEFVEPVNTPAPENHIHQPCPNSAKNKNSKRRDVNNFQPDLYWWNKD